MTARLRVSFALALLPAALALRAVAAAPIPSATAAPGQVVRWDGEGLTRCAAGGETWAPMAGSCWYPVDLLRAPGSYPVERWAGETHETASVEVTPPPYAEEKLKVDQRKVTLRPKDLERARREAAEVAPLWALRTPIRFSLPLAAPLANAPKARNFGVRRVFNGEARSPHGGADFAAAVGTPALALADGRVVLVADHFFSGKAVYLDHGDGLVSMVCHLSRTDVKQGQTVSRGQRVGLSGATGRVSGPHLHLTIRWRAARVDPSVLLGDPAAMPRIGGRARP